WSSDVCSSDLLLPQPPDGVQHLQLVGEPVHQHRNAQRPVCHRLHLPALRYRPSHDSERVSHTSSLLWTRRITSSVNSVVVADPPRSAVRTPERMASKAPS